MMGNVNIRKELIQPMILVTPLSLNMYDLRTQ
jgi:hypothetical protein